MRRAAWQAVWQDTGKASPSCSDPDIDLDPVQDPVQTDEGGVAAPPADPPGPGSALQLQEVSQDNLRGGQPGQAQLRVHGLRPARQVEGRGAGGGSRGLVTQLTLVVWRSDNTTVSLSVAGLGGFSLQIRKMHSAVQSPLTSCSIRDITSLTVI